ncbi:hypothetical protein CAEBREN_11778 [Caenorhabditis brenneri]|uniref:SPK domain-containing protein n=1 Tax=Caenorhabditis brenneri TaxID=135651 RepID=G0PJD0_CAEBE|nr:hypothetical protein CAEBREN_11778 [Caenorhabditis brenneri]
MSRWSKQDSMIMMKFLIDEAKTIDKKFIPYGFITIVSIEFPSDLIPGREPSELKEKARYLLNEEIQNFHTFPLKDRIWCLHVFKVYLNYKMQEEVTSSNSLHNVRISGGSLSLELEDGTPLMFYTRPVKDTSPDENMETIWPNEEEEDEVPRNDDVGSNNHRSDEIPVQDVVNPEDSTSRSESPREEDRDDIMEHVEHEAPDLPAPELEDDDEHAPSISPNAQFINEAEDQTEPEATTSTEREVTDSDGLEDVAAPQSERNEMDKRIAGVTRDYRNLDQIPDQDVVDLEGSPSRSGSPKEVDRDETVKHNAEPRDLPAPNFAVDDEHDSSNPPNPPIIYEAAEQLEAETTSRTERADVKNRAPERFQKLNAVERLAKAPSTSAQNVMNNRPGGWISSVSNSRKMTHNHKRVSEDFTRTADLIISEYRKQSEVFNLKEFVMANCTKQCFNKTYLEMHRYFPADFFDKMNDEEFVLRNKDAPMNNSLYRLRRSSIFQLDERNRLTFYSSIGRTFGAMNMEKPVQMEVSEYIIIVFLKELTRISEKQRPTDEIFKDFQNWRKRPASQKDIVHFLNCFEKIKSSVHTRRDLTTQDKQKILHIAGAPIPKDFFQRCNRFYFLNQHPTGTHPSYLPQDQSKNSSIEANAKDAQLVNSDTSSEDRSPVEEQRGNSVETVGEPVAPMVQQEEQLNIAAPIEDLAPRNLPTVGRIELGEAPIQLVEDGPRNDDPNPNIDQESEIPYSELLTFAILKRGEPEELADKFIGKKKRPKSDRPYLVEVFQKIFEKKKEFDQTRPSTHVDDQICGDLPGVMETQKLNSEPGQSASYPQTPSTSTAEQHEMTNGSEQFMDVGRIPSPSEAGIDHSKDSIDECEDFQHDEDVTMESVNGGLSTDKSLPPVDHIVVEKDSKCGTDKEAEKCSGTPSAGERSHSGSGSKIDSKRSEERRKKKRSRKISHVDSASSSKTVHKTNTSTFQEFTKDDLISSVSFEIPTSSCSIPPDRIEDVTTEFSNEGSSTGISLSPVTPVGIPIQDGGNLEGEQPGGHRSNDGDDDVRGLKTDEAESNSKNSEAPKEKKQIHLPKPSLKGWKVKNLRKLARFLDQERQVEWLDVIERVEKTGKELEEKQFLKLRSEAQLALSKNFEKLVQPKAEKLKFLRKLRVPVGENIRNDISKDTLFQLDHNDCITFFCYQAVRRGKRDENAPDNLSQLHRVLLNSMVSLSNGRFLSNKAILNSLRMDERRGLTDNELLNEIEDAKKFIASDDKNKFRDCLRVLKSTRTPVTELLLSQAEHNFEVKKNEKNIIISYYKPIKEKSSSTEVDTLRKCSPVNLPTSESNGAEEVTVSSAGVCDVQCSTPGMIEAPVPSPAQHSLTELPGSSISTTTEETLRTVTTIPVASIQVDKVPATPAAKPSMSSIEAEPSRRTGSSTEPVVQHMTVKRKRDETKEGKSAKEAKHFKRNEDKPNSTAVATVQNCSAANFPTPESKRETSTSSTVIPDGETSKAIADVETDSSVPMETDGFSLGVSRNSSAPEQIDVANQVAPTKATPAASDVTESSKTLNNQMLSQEEFDDIMNFFEQQFALHPYKFLDLEKVCGEYIMKHGFDKDPTEVGEKFMGYGIQVGENGRLQELHWSDTVYFGEPMRENVIAYLTELSSTSLRYRPIEELANGYEKWREANLNLETPIEVDSYLYWRIPEIVEDVMKMENLSDVLKVTLMMLTGTPITKEFRNRLIKMNKIITDEKERIVFFQEKKDTNVQLQQSYSPLGLSIQQL